MRYKSIAAVKQLCFLVAVSLVGINASMAQQGSLPGAPGSLPAPVELSTGWQLQDIAKITDDGTSISSVAYAPANWYNATVPGTVLTSLVDDGVYPDPLYGENDRPNIIPESLCRTSYWYRTKFTVPKNFAGRGVSLNFDGINYKAEVWVNGHDLGPIKGAFARGQFDITPFVTVGDSNALAVEILPPPDPGTPLEQTVANGTGRNGGILTEDGPTFLSTLGWDWIPGIRDRDMGIWQGVSISANGPVTIHDPYVTSDLPLPRTDSADLTIQATLVNSTQSAQNGNLVGNFGSNQFTTSISLAPGETKSITLTTKDIPQLHVQNPKLWWPNTYGPQNLYNLDLKFVQNGTVDDQHSTTFGIRKITYFVNGSDNLTLSVNGVEVIAKGGDWGMDEAMKRIPYSRMDAQIHLHQLANYTMIRNWVGQSTSEEFYDLCDKYGILVWDEFFQPNKTDGPDPLDDDLYIANVKEKMLRFRSHPSIALWCARNESDPPPVIDTAIQGFMATLDPTRYYQHSSTAGHGVKSGGPYNWQPPRAYYNIDTPFKTEIGLMSVPTLESIHAMMPQKDWDTYNDDWAMHDFLRGAQRGNVYPLTIAKRYGDVQNLPDFVRKSQLANYEGFRAMYEGRFASLFNPVTGILTWMSNPTQNSFVWQIFSHDLEANSSLFGTRKACEPVHIQMNQSTWHLEVVNSTPNPLSAATANVAIYNLDSTLASQVSVPVSAQQDAATDLGVIIFPANVSTVHFVKLTLVDHKGKVISDNFYWRTSAAPAPLPTFGPRRPPVSTPGTPAPPPTPEQQAAYRAAQLLPPTPAQIWQSAGDDFSDLNAMATVSLNLNVTRKDTRGGNFELNVTVTNPTHRIALMAHLQLRQAKSGMRVLPVYYSDNYFSLVPGETKTITIQASRSSLKGEMPEIVVDGWNDTVMPSNGDVLVAPNTEAIVN